MDRETFTRLVRSSARLDFTAETLFCPDLGAPVAELPLDLVLRVAGGACMYFSPSARAFVSVDATLHERLLTLAEGALTEGDRHPRPDTALGRYVTTLRVRVDDLVRVMPGVPFAEGMARLRSADLLVLAAWSDPDARLYVQGKLFDYLAAGRPVVAETAHEDVTRILADTRAGFVVAPGDVRAMTDLVRRALAPGGLPAAVAVPKNASLTAQQSLELKPRAAIAGCVLGIDPSLRGTGLAGRRLPLARSKHSRVLFSPTTGPTFPIWAT